MKQRVRAENAARSANMAEEFNAIVRTVVDLERILEHAYNGPDTAQNEIIVAVDVYGENQGTGKPVFAQLCFDGTPETCYQINLIAKNSNEHTPLYHNELEVWKRNLNAFIFLLENEKVTKIFNDPRISLSILQEYLDCEVKNVYCVRHAHDIFGLGQYPSIQELFNRWAPNVTLPNKFTQDSYRSKTYDWSNEICALQSFPEGKARKKYKRALERAKFHVLHLHEIREAQMTEFESEPKRLEAFKEDMKSFRDSYALKANCYSENLGWQGDKELLLKDEMKLDFRGKKINYEVITSKRRLKEVCEMKKNALEKKVAVDLEFDDIGPCLAQLNFGNSTCYLVNLLSPELDHDTKSSRVKRVAPLLELFEDETIAKIMHDPREDVKHVWKYYGTDIKPIICTQQMNDAAGNGRRVGFKQVLYAFTKVVISKENQRDDWRAACINGLSSDQKRYAAADVRFSHELLNLLTKAMHEKGKLKPTQVPLTPEQIKLVYEDMKTMRWAYNRNEKFCSVSLPVPLAQEMMEVSYSDVSGRKRRVEEVIDDQEELKSSQKKRFRGAR